MITADVIDNESKKVLSISPEVQEEINIFSKRYFDFISKIYDEDFFMCLGIKELEHLLNEADELQQQYKNLELIVKKDANSLYGTSASIYFSLVDYDVAGDITGTGKHYAILVDVNINNFFVTWGEKELEIIQKFYPEVTELKKFTEYKRDTVNDVCTYGDTDSRYINLEKIYTFLLKADGTPIKMPLNTDEGNKELSDFAILLMDNFISNIIKTCIDEDLEFRNGNKGFLKMNHEVTTRKCVFQAKKKYVLTSIWKDGKMLDKPKLKVLGVELKQGGLNSRIKRIIEQLVINFLLKDYTVEKLREECIKLMTYIRKRAEKSFIYKISSVSGLKDIYQDETGVYKSTKSHIQMKMALFWYNFIEQNNLQDQYQRPFEGQKMNFYYGANNAGVVAVPDDVDIDSVKGLPEPDWNLMLRQILIKNILKYITDLKVKELTEKEIDNFLLGAKKLNFA